MIFRITVKAKPNLRKLIDRILQDLQLFCKALSIFHTSCRKSAVDRRRMEAQITPVHIRRSIINTCGFEQFANERCFLFFRKHIRKTHHLDQFIQRFTIKIVNILQSIDDRSCIHFIRILFLHINAIIQIILFIFLILNPIILVIFLRMYFGIQLQEHLTHGFIEFIIGFNIRCILIFCFPI